MSLDGPYVSFTAYLSTSGVLGTILNHPTATVGFKNFGATPGLTFDVDVDNVMKVPFSFHLSGRIGTDKSFDISATVTAGPWHGSTDLGLCTGYYDAHGSFQVHLTGGDGHFAIAVTFDGSAGAGCGSIGVSIGIRMSFSYTSPATFDMHLKLHLGFGSLGSWDPTLV